MANHAGKSQRNTAIVLAIINFIYLMFSAVLLAPGMYLDIQTGVYSKAYGAAAAVYSMGILYGFFEKLLSSKKVSEEEYQRTGNAISVLLAIVNIIAVALYYFAFSDYPGYLIVISYICVLGTAGVSFFQAIVLLAEYAEYKAQR